MTPEQIAAKDAEHGGPGWRISKSEHRRLVVMLPPGSEKAIARGCLCDPVIPLIAKECPLHGNAE